LIVRVHCCIGGAVAAGAVVVVAAVGVAGVTDFTNSVSALGDSAKGFAVSETGATSLIAGTGFGSEALSSATGLSAVVAGVCPLAITAVSKLKVITVNEAKMETGDLEPSIWYLSFTSAADETLKDLMIKCDTRAFSRGKVRSFSKSKAGVSGLPARE
jgi:hypothetical protein